MLSRLAVGLFSLLLVALLLGTAFIIWLCVSFTKMTEICSDKCIRVPGNCHVDSSNPSLTNTSITFVKFFRNLTISYQNIPSFVNDTFLSEGLTNLEEISVDFSQLRTIEVRAFNGLTNLEKLSLNDNGISEILPRTFENLSRLKELYLRNNIIKHLNNDVFSGLSSLTVLNLDHNDLQYIHPDTLLRLPKLRELHLHSNKALQVPTDRPFIYSHSLTYLAISHSNIPSLAVETFSNLFALKQLDVNGNKLRTLDINILKAWPKLFILYLQGNPLQCDCQLQEVWRWCEDRSITTWDHDNVPKCDTPENVKGKPWTVLEKGRCLGGNIFFSDYSNSTN